MELDLNRISTVFHLGNLGAACVQTVTENPITALCGFAFRGMMFEVTKRIIRASTSASTASSSTEEGHA